MSRGITELASQVNATFSEPQALHLMNKTLNCFITSPYKELVGRSSVPKNTPQHLKCLLSKRIFVDPVKTKYGTVYERKAIEEHLKTYGLHFPLEYFNVMCNDIIFLMLFPG